MRTLAHNTAAAPTLMCPHPGLRVCQWAQWADYFHKYEILQLTLLTILTSRHTHSHTGFYLFFPSLVVHLCESSRYECCYLVVYIQYPQTDYRI